MVARSSCIVICLVALASCLAVELQPPQVQAVSIPVAPATAEAHQHNDANRQASQLLAPDVEHAQSESSQSPSGDLTSSSLIGSGLAAAGPQMSPVVMNDEHATNMDKRVAPVSSSSSSGSRSIWARRTRPNNQKQDKRHKEEKVAIERQDDENRLRASTTTVAKELDSSSLSLVDGYHHGQKMRLNASERSRKQARESGSQSQEHKREIDDDKREGKWDRLD